MRALPAILVLLVVALPAAAAPVVPASAPESFLARASHGNVLETYAWRFPESFAQRRQRGGPFVGDVVERDGTRWYGASASGPGVVERRIHAARPDAFSYEELVTGPGEFALARARAGKLRLAAVRVGGRRALRARVFVRANVCAGVPAGAREVVLDRATLLPLRLVERRGRRSFLQSFRYGAAGAAAFARPRLGSRPRTDDHGFVRSSPAAVAGRLSYEPLLPSSLPTGFRLAVTGSAARSARTGPEGSNPRYAELFGAVYRRGPERIDVTQRLAGPGGWRSDPFGRECEFQFEERATIGGRTARYGVGPNIPSHLYWRDGRLLLTVSGPLPKRELVAIAESLAPRQAAP